MFHLFEEEFLLENNNTYYLKELLKNKKYSDIYLATDWHLFKCEVTGDEKNEHKIDLKRYQLVQNALVKNTDIFIYLGDLAHKRCNEEHYEKLREFINNLNGVKILIKGNHDIKPDEYYYSCGFSYVLDELIFDKIVFTHRPVKLKNYEGVKLNIHGHMHGSNIYLESEKKNHIDIYRKDYKPVTLEYVLNHKEDMMADNISSYDSSEKVLNNSLKKLKIYQKLVVKFYNQHPEYLNLTLEDQYKKQKEIVDEFLNMPEIIKDEELIGWDCKKMRSKEAWNKLKYKPESMKDYHHVIILNKDNEICIDFCPELIGGKTKFYSHGKYALKFKWTVCDAFTSSRKPSPCPQNALTAYMKDHNIPLN